MRMEKIARTLYCDLSLSNGLTHNNSTCIFEYYEISYRFWLTNDFENRSCKRDEKRSWGSIGDMPQLVQLFPLHAALCVRACVWVRAGVCMSPCLRVCVCLRTCVCICVCGCRSCQNVTPPACSGIVALTRVLVKVCHAAFTCGPFLWSQCARFGGSGATKPCSNTARF